MNKLPKSIEQKMKIANLERKPLKIGILQEMKNSNILMNMSRSKPYKRD